MRLLVTGGAGFIGSNFIQYILEKYPEYQVTNLDKLTYAGNLDNLKPVEKNPNHRFVKGDICDLSLAIKLAKETDVIINFAAESHVDRSIDDPFIFIDTNIRGTCSLIQAARDTGHNRYIQISTDEVYGDFANGGKATESSPLHASSPYSAAKAGADLQVLSANRTFGFPGMITRCTNNYGPNQYPEKLIPLYIINALQDKELPLYGDGRQIRDWLHVNDHCSAIDLVLHKGTPGEIYNIAAEQDTEVTNRDIALRILRYSGKPESLIKSVADRPGHDRRYAVNSTKIRQMGWAPAVYIDQGLKQTLVWYKENNWWWKDN